MSIDTKSQVRAYADFLDSTLPVLEARDAMVELIGAPPVQPVQERPVRRVGQRSQPLTPVPRRRGMRVALAAVMVGLLFAGAIWLTRGDGDRDVIEQPTDTSTFLSSLTWSRVPHDDAAFSGGWMGGVTVGGPGLVAVGHVGPGPLLHDESAAAVWTSVDGNDWSRIPHDESLSGGVMNSISAGGPGLVAVGSATIGNSIGSAVEVAAVWTSVDGMAWSRVPHDEAVFGESDFTWPGLTMNSVTVGGPGLVAVGHLMSNQGTYSNAVVWTSADGIIWSRVPHDDAIFGRKELSRCCTSMHSVIAGGPGLVAVGGDWLDGEGGRATVWTSVDGITWSRVPHDEAVFGDAGLSSVTAGGPGLVAVGSAGFEEDGPIAAVWTSEDGVTWSRVAHDEAIFGEGEGPPGSGGSEMSGVAATGNGVVAVGSEFVRNATLPYDGWVTAAAVWTSADGVEWSRVPHDESVFEAQLRPEALMNGAAAGGSGVVVVGVTTVHDFWASHNDSGESDAAVWVGVMEE